MKPRFLFDDNGHVIRTRSRLRDSLHNALLVLFVLLVILVLPSLLSEHDIDVDAGPADAYADHMAEVEAAYAEGMRAGLAQGQCRREKLL